MDSDPLVPNEISPTKKYLTFAVVGLLAIFLIVCMVLLGIQAHKLNHKGAAASAVALALLTVAIVLVNLWLPQDYMETKAKVAVMILNICLFLVAICMLVQSYEKTPCPDCPKPNLCTLSGAIEGAWITKPDCFPNDTANSTHFLAISTNKTCPSPVPPGPGIDQYMFDLSADEFF